MLLVSRLPSDRTKVCLVVWVVLGVELPTYPLWGSSLFVLLLHFTELLVPVASQLEIRWTLSRFGFVLFVVFF